MKQIVDIYQDKDTDYGYAVGRIRVLENRLLKTADYETLLATQTFKECITILLNTVYGDYLSRFPAQDWENALVSSISDLYREFEKILPDRVVMDMFRLRYDFFNLGLIKKNIISGDEDFLGYCIKLGNISPDTLKELCVNKRYEKLPAGLSECLQKMDREEGLDFHTIDITADRGYYHTIFHMVEGNEFLRGFVSLRIDLYNIKTFLRAKKFGRDVAFYKEYFLHHGRLKDDVFVGFYEDDLMDILHRLVSSPYYEIIETAMSTWGYDKSLRKIDKAEDDFLTDVLSRSRLVPFGPEPVVAYIWAREMEIKNLRLILMGKQNGVEPQWIREYIRRVM